MVKAHYEIVEHDGGWAYRMQGTYSETFPSKAAAEAAAIRAAAEQRVPANPKRSNMRTARADGMSSTRRAKTGPTRMSPSRSLKAPLYAAYCERCRPLRQSARTTRGIQCAFSLPTSP